MSNIKKMYVITSLKEQNDYASPTKYRRGPHPTLNTIVEAQHHPLNNMEYILYSNTAFAHDITSLHATSFHIHVASCLAPKLARLTGGALGVHVKVERWGWVFKSNGAGIVRRPDTALKFCLQIQLVPLQRMLSCQRLHG